MSILGSYIVRVCLERWAGKGGGELDLRSGRCS